MNNIEFNKIFAAILVAGIIASLSGFVSKKLVHSKELEENAFKIEGVDDPADTGPKIEPLAEPILAMIGSADIARGQAISKQCAACHSFDKGGANGVGPNLYGVVGAKKQAKDGFTYSGVLAERGDVWTYSAMNQFLWKPKWYAPKTKMNYLGVKKPQDRAALIAWLNTQSDSSLGAPTEQEIAAELLELATPIEETKEEVQETMQMIDEKQGDIE